MARRIVRDPGQARPAEGETPLLRHLAGEFVAKYLPAEGAAGPPAPPSPIGSVPR